MENHFTLTSAANDNRSILCIDDDQDMRDRLAALLEMANFKVSLAKSVSEALTLAKQGRFDLILLDSYLSDGRTLCRQIREFDQRTPILYYTGEARYA